MKIVRKQACPDIGVHKFIAGFPFFAGLAYFLNGLVYTAGGRRRRQLRDAA